VTAATDLDRLAAAVIGLAGARSAAQIADYLARPLHDLAGVTYASVYLRARTGEPLRLRATAGLAPAGLTDRIEPNDDSLIGRAARSTTWLADDGRLAIPILLGAEVVGVAELVGGSGLGGDETRATVTALTTIAATALERDRLRASERSAAGDARTAAARVTSFSRLGALLASAVTRDDVGRLLVEHLVPDLGAEFGLLYVPDQRDLVYRLVHARGYPTGLMRNESTISAAADGPVTRAGEARRPVEIGSPDAWRREFPTSSDLPAMTGARSLVAWPLGDGERLEGVLVIGWPIEDQPNDEAREALVSSAAQAVQALERARLYAQEREAQELQDAFISVISHELRTPITTILAGSRLLRRRTTRSPAVRDLAVDVEAEADRLFRIVEDLLVLSRLERRSLSVAQEPVHLSHVVERILRSEARRWPTTTFLAPDHAEIRVARGEETYVEQILRNLLSNAAKYAPAGSTVEVVVEDADDGVAVRVLDEGPGIARDEVEQLFTLFYRSPATAATAAGAGIGLFVSRRLVDEMGGRMWARPRAGGGSEFGFSLSPYPADEDDEEPEPIEPTAEELGATEPIAGRAPVGSRTRSG